MPYFSESQAFGQCDLRVYLLPFLLIDNKVQTMADNQP